MSDTKKISHYIEFIYPYNPDVADSMEDTYFKEVEKREPLLFINNRDAEMTIGFRFFDVSSNRYPRRDNRINISPIYYYGRYLTDEEIEYIYGKRPYTCKSKKMIECFCGYTATELGDGDITIDELINQEQKEKKVEGTRLQIVKELKYKSL